MIMRSQSTSPPSDHRLRISDTVIPLAPSPEAAASPKGAGRPDKRRSQLNITP